MIGTEHQFTGLNPKGSGPSDSPAARPSIRSRMRIGSPWELGEPLQRRNRGGEHYARVGSALVRAGGLTGSAAGLFSGLTGPAAHASARS